MSNRWLDPPAMSEFWLRDARVAVGFLAAPLPMVPIDAEGFARLDLRISGGAEPAEVLTCIRVRSSS